MVRTWIENGVKNNDISDSHTRGNFKNYNLSQYKEVYSFSMGARNTLGAPPTAAVFRF